MEVAWSLLLPSRAAARVSLRRDRRGFKQHRLRRRHTLQLPLWAVWRYYSHAPDCWNMIA